MKSYDIKKAEIEQLVKQAETTSYEYSYTMEARGYDPNDYLEVYQYCDSYELRIETERIVDDGEIYFFDADIIVETLVEAINKSDARVIKDEDERDVYRVCFLDTLTRVTL